LAQLRHLLPAERSSEVPQKYEHERLFFPQIAEKPFSAIGHRYFGIESFVDVVIHIFSPHIQISRLSYFAGINGNRGSETLTLL
jgi:hypothetical protein